MVYRNWVWCGKELNITVTDHSHLDIESHDGIYKDDPKDWYPHYDVEYFCHGDCEYYEHYTHDVDGTLIGMRVNKVFYNFENRQFSIVEGTVVTPVGRLPDGVVFGSELFGFQPIPKEWRCHPRNFPFFALWVYFSNRRKGVF